MAVLAFSITLADGLNLSHGWPCGLFNWKEKIPGNYPSSWRLSLCEVIFFLTLENKDTSSVLLWTIEQILKFDIACSSYFFMNKLHHKMLIVYIFASPSSSVLIVASDNCEWSKSNKVIDCNNRNPLPSEEIVEKWKDHKTLVLQWEIEYSQMRIFGCKN